MFNKYYQDELVFLRDMGREFSAANPEAARFLAEPGSDPDVERMLEGFAFLAAKLRQKLDDALPECWKQAIAAGAKGPVELTLDFTIRWSGRTSGVSVSGGTSALQACVRKAVPGANWPQPRDGGDAKVTRRWTLGGA